MELLTCTQTNGVLNKTTLDFCMERRHALIVKWYLATDEDVEDDTENPHIDFGASVSLGVQNLRRRKVE